MSFLEGPSCAHIMSALSLAAGLSLYLLRASASTSSFPGLCTTCTVQLLKAASSQILWAQADRTLSRPVPSESTCWVAMLSVLTTMSKRWGCSGSRCFTAWRRFKASSCAMLGLAVVYPRS